MHVLYLTMQAGQPNVIIQRRCELDLDALSQSNNLVEVRQASHLWALLCIGP